MPSRYMEHTSVPHGTMTLSFAKDSGFAVKMLETCQKKKKNKQTSLLKSTQPQSKTSTLWCNHV